MLKYNFFVLVQQTVNQLTQFKKLLQLYEENVKENPSLILKTNDFTEIQQENFLDFLSKYSQSLNHVELWDKLTEWTIAQSNGELPSNTNEWTPEEITRFGTIIKPFISHINFEKINFSYFRQKIKPFKNIFDNDFYVEVLENYSFNENIHSKFKIDVDSKIITPYHAFLLYSLIRLAKKNDQPATIRLELLVRGSKDGFDLQTFHECCNQKGPTITIASVKSTNEIIGGFNPIDWSKECRYVSTEESFIFSLDKNKLTNYIFSKVVDEEHAVYKGRGPDFGDKKSDLRLLEKGKKGQCFKNSYEKLIRSEEGVFEIDDYEVFQVVTEVKL